MSPPCRHHQNKLQPLQGNMERQGARVVQLNASVLGKLCIRNVQQCVEQRSRENKMKGRARRDLPSDASISWCYVMPASSSKGPCKRPSLPSDSTSNEFQHVISPKISRVSPTSSFLVSQNQPISNNKNAKKDNGCPDLLKYLHLQPRA